jgi:hypothetical protein
VIWTCYHRQALDLYKTPRWRARFGGACGVCQWPLGFLRELAFFFTPHPKRGSRGSLFRFIGGDRRGRFLRKTKKGWPSLGRASAAASRRAKISMQRHEEVRNPDGMPCEFSGRGSAKNWYYWVESDAAGAAVGQAVGQKRRHWYAAGGDGRAYKDGVKLLKARAKAGDIDEIVPWHHGSSLPQLATSSIVASTVGSSLPTNSFTLATSAIAVPPPPPLPPLPPSQQMLLPAFPSSSSGAEYGASLGCAGPAYAESVEAPLQDQIAQPALRQHDGGPVIDQRAQALTHPYSLHGACDVSVRDVCVPSDQRQLGSAASTLMTNLVCCDALQLAASASAAYGGTRLYAARPTEPSCPAQCAPAHRLRVDPSRAAAAASATAARGFDRSHLCPQR